MKNLAARVSHSMRRRWSHARGDAQLRHLNQQIAENAAVNPGTHPVIFFNASTRLSGLSLNAAYNLITSWAIHLSGVPVVNFVCQRGVSHCVLGTNRDDPTILPPCAECIQQSRAVYSHQQAHHFVMQENQPLLRELVNLNVPELMVFEHQGVPLGKLVLPSIRWILRRHHLLDDESTRYLYGQYILSASNIQKEFTALIDQVRPQAVVVFNGMFYPEATARWAAERLKVRVISHEVGLRPFTSFFTTGDATAYPIQIPDAFQLNDEQNQLLDDYLEKRMQGNFSMAGIRFWPEMRRLDDDFLARLSQFRQVVPVFTNVIFDTSQPHSNVVFSDMFAWLDGVIDLSRAHPETLFMIRAHPDEARPGKESRESVSDWVRKNQVSELPNVIFVEPQQYLSSYELIQRSKFVMVYNSTIGLEASLMGVPVLCGGKARFTQLPTVFFPETQTAYWQQAETFLSATEIAVPPEFIQNARRFLYYQLYRTSLPFDDFIEEDGVWQGYVRIKNLDYQAFDPRSSVVLKTIVDGILYGQEFLINA